MPVSKLLGKRVALMISDPWEFVTECGVGPFYGEITDIGEERITSLDIERALISLERFIQCSDATYVSAICYIRHEGFSLNNLGGKATVSVNVILLPAQAMRFPEVNADDIRKGFVATGSIERT